MARIFFIPIRSGMTRWSIWPSVSSVSSSSPMRPCRSWRPALREFDSFPKLESVIVGDDDLGPVHIVEHVVRNDFAAGVVAVGVIGLKDAQPGFDRQAGCTDQEATGKVFAGRVSDGIDGLPR